MAGPTENDAKLSTQPKPSTLRRLLLKKEDRPYIAVTAATDVAIVEDLAEPKPKLLYLVKAREALDLDDRDSVRLVTPGEVVVWPGYWWRPRAKALVADVLGKLILQPTMSPQPTASGVRISGCGRCCG